MTWVLSDEAALGILEITCGATEEHCGLVYDNDVVEITNVHEDPHNFFTMDDTELFEVWSRWGPPDAVWHNHTSSSPEPSTADIAGAPEGIAYLIIVGNHIYHYEY